MATYIIQAPGVRLTIDAETPLSAEEWIRCNRLLVSLWYRDGPQEPEGAVEPQEDPQRASDTVWKGPLDISVIGLMLGAGESAIITQSHTEVHVGTMHRWAREHRDSDTYVCGHGGCFASATVTRENA